MQALTEDKVLSIFSNAEQKPKGFVERAKFDKCLGGIVEKGGMLGGLPGIGLILSHILNVILSVFNVI